MTNMLRSLVGTRRGRRVITVLVIAALVVSSLAIYMQMSQQKNVNPLTRPGGSGYITGIPKSVNLTSVHTWIFPLRLAVTESFVSGVQIGITQNSTFSSAAAYFSFSGSNWTTENGNLTLASGVSYYTAGTTDNNISLVVQGTANAAGWVGIYVRTVLGKVTPGFSKVTVYGYKGGVTPPAEKYIRFGNLPATLQVNSGAAGNYLIEYKTSGTAGDITWTANTSWVSVSGAGTANASASYTAPVVTENTSYVVSITATSVNGVTNTSTITFDVIAPTGSRSPHIALDNLPATITVFPGEQGTFVVNYTAMLIAGGLSWAANQTWVKVSTFNSTTAFANYTAPVVSVNSTYIALISVTSVNGANNSSTLTFNVIVNRTSPPPAPGIAFDNLPAEITVDSGMAGQYIIGYVATGISGSISWTANQSWVAVSGVNDTAAAANYTAPVVTENTSYVVSITAASVNGVTNTSTITFHVIAPYANNTTAIITTSIYLNNSELEIHINGGIYLNIVLPANQTNSTLIIYTTIVMNNSELDAVINGGVHLNIRSSSSGMLTIYTYTVLNLNNSELRVKVRGGVDVDVNGSGNLTVNLVQQTQITSTNSSISIHTGGAETNVIGTSPHSTLPSGSMNLSYHPFYTKFYLNNSELEIHINGGLRLSFSVTEAQRSTPAIYTNIYLNNSELEVELEGGVRISLLEYPPGQTALSTSIALNNTETEIELYGLRVPSGTGHGNARTDALPAAGNANGQTASASEGALFSTPTTIKLASHGSTAPTGTGGSGSISLQNAGLMSGGLPMSTFSGPPQSSGPPVIQ